MNLGLYYYNARYYLPGAGRFLSADTLVPDPQNPQSFNRYAYVLNSPINFSDPTGHCATEQAQYEDCLALKRNIQEQYQVSIEGDWLYAELVLINDGIALLLGVFEQEGLANPIGAFVDVFTGVRLIRQAGLNIGRAVTQGKNKIIFTDIAFKEYDAQQGVATDVDRDPNAVYGTVIHELGHIWDNRTGGELSNGLMEAVSGQFSYCFFKGCNSYENYNKTCFLVGCRIYTVIDNSPHPGINPVNDKEDWAWTFTAFVVDQNSLGLLNQNDLRTPYISQQIQQIED